MIWDRYYKPYKKDDRKGMGTGLGLSIVKAILEAHHFAYGVDSHLGEGSTFWFETAPRGKKAGTQRELMGKGCILSTKEV